MTEVRAARRSWAVAAVLLFGSCPGAPLHAATPLPAPLSSAQADAGLCQLAIAAVEQRFPVPRRLLSAIALTESGRVAPGGRAAAWPWTINVGGIGTFYDTADAAVAAAEALQLSGVRSFDVGCMQVNLMHHPHAFPSLRDAFDPTLNAGYAALFLGQLHTELGDWSHTVAAYHSRAAEAGADYQRKVVRSWPDAAAYGVVASPDVGKSPAAPGPAANRGSGIEAKLREAMADHTALTRRIVGDGPSGSPGPSRRGTPGALRLAQGGDGRESALRR